MRSTPRIFSIVLSGCLLAGIAVSGFAAGSTGGLPRLRLDRLAVVDAPLPLEETALQPLAQKIGCGHFFVRTVVIAEGGPAVADARVFFLYSTPEAVQPGAAQMRILYRGVPPALLLADGGPEDMVRGFFASATAGGAVAELVARQMPGVLAAVLFEGRAQLWSNEGGATFELQLRQRDGGLAAANGELRSLARAPQVSRDPAGQLVWRGRFLRDDGGIEEVTATLPEKAEEPVILKRVELKPAGFGLARGGPDLSVEEWVVTKETSWKAPQRYKMMLTLAALGNAEKQFQLGAALLQEADHAAHAEGFKWLKAAAAQGHRAATDLLTQSQEQLVRPDRDRDKVRVLRCCPVPGR